MGSPPGNTGGFFSAPKCEKMQPAKGKCFCVLSELSLLGLDGLKNIHPCWRYISPDQCALAKLKSLEFCVAFTSQVVGELYEPTILSQQIPDTICDSLCQVVSKPPQWQSGDNVADMFGVNLSWQKFRKLSSIPGQHVELWKSFSEMPGHGF